MNTIPGMRQTMDGRNVRAIAAVYRFFPEEWQADALTHGKIWLSTLETCRQYENPSQGDSQEAFLHYNSGHIHGSQTDPDLRNVAERSGMLNGPDCFDVTIDNVKSTQYLFDAYVLCTTERFNPEALSETFGRYCVEIKDPAEFLRLTTIELRRVHRIREALCGRIKYEERSYKGLEEPPGLLGFVKPPDRYSNQGEFRFLWTVNEPKPIRPFLLEAPSTAKLCRRAA